MSLCRIRMASMFRPMPSMNELSDQGQSRFVQSTTYLTRCTLYTRFANALFLVGVRGWVKGVGSHVRRTSKTDYRSTVHASFFVCLHFLKFRVVTTQPSRTVKVLLLRPTLFRTWEPKSGFPDGMDDQNIRSKARYLDQNYRHLEDARQVPD
ncbi:hypothetical protein SODALDRAFT_93478 [Sodiomyces alkalinus F11]|uniref:Uncharacterized protein n=1 Tax=Sodiomyces alkalinus (strain CBS 110278 / VKM F-3762 / F11) TaxID=1314773 RepID=A0A3N2Q0M0_SODAK|nr:hypothetical protein SODALDRAFT_93478 [Sodiomyces alkalinus F11]ROT40314.1 hypothetical protein SODALDRAFT_93478 [Sodiomyces alkalinus F11]